MLRVTRQVNKHKLDAGARCDVDVDGEGVCDGAGPGDDDAADDGEDEEGAAAAAAVMRVLLMVRVLAILVAMVLVRTVVRMPVVMLTLRRQCRGVRHVACESL